MGQQQLTVSDASDLIWVCRHLAAALQGHQSVVVALDAITEAAPPRACQFLQAMRQAAESGGKLGRALGAAGVPAYAWGLVYAGEVSNRLGECCTTLAELLEAERQLPEPQDPLLFAYGLAFLRVAALLGKGVPVLQAFEAAAESASLPGVATTLLAAREAISQGLTVGDALPTVTEDLPPLVVEMIGDGEAQGRIESVLAIAADYLFDEAGPKEA